MKKLISFCIFSLVLLVIIGRVANANENVKLIITNSPPSTCMIANVTSTISPDWDKTKIMLIPLESKKIK